MSKQARNFKPMTQNYPLDSFLFDVTGFAFIFFLRDLFGKEDFLASLFSPVLAALLVFLSLGLIALKINTLFLLAREKNNAFLGLVLAGANALMTFAQPLVLTAMLRNFSILPDEPFLLIAFFVGLAVILPVFLNYPSDKPGDLLKYFGVSLAAGILFFGKLPIEPTLDSFIVLGLSALVYAISFIAYSPTLRAKTFPLIKKTFQKNMKTKIFRVTVSNLASFLMWIWFTLAIESIGKSDPELSLGGKLMILYFTGPLLYRFSLMILPPFSWLNFFMGLLVFIASLYA